jgi:hypothetical protein
MVKIKKFNARYLGLHEEIGRGEVEGQTFKILRELNTSSMIFDFGQGERYIITLRAMAEGVMDFRKKAGGCGPCSVCQTETTYCGEHNGDYPVWLCPDHGGSIP